MAESKPKNHTKGADTDEYVHGSDDTDEKLPDGEHENKYAASSYSTYHYPESVASDYSAPDCESTFTPSHWSPSLNPANIHHLSLTIQKIHQ